MPKATSCATHHERRTRVLWIATVLVATAVTGLRAQARDNPAFDAASVKPVPFGSPLLRLGVDFTLLPGRFVATNVTLDQLIEQAYGIEPRQLNGGPGWIHTDLFYVTAATGGNIARDQVMLMLKSLLAERFKLQIERETKSGTVYVLTAPNAHDLKSPAHPDERPMVQTFREDTRGYLSYHYDGHNATIAALALHLAGQVRAPVIDQTRLTGSYDFRINWASDRAFGGLEPDPDVPTIFTALQNDVGLKLTPDKGPVEVYVVRGAVKPAED